MEDKRILDPERVRTRLREVGPTRCWLSISRVERVVGWGAGDLSAFFESIKSAERGSTRQQTKLSPAQKALEDDGIFFKLGHVSVGSRGSSPPDWAGPKYTSIEEPRLNTFTRNPCVDGSRPTATLSTPAGLSGESPHTPTRLQGSAVGLPSDETRPSTPHGDESPKPTTGVVDDSKSVDRSPAAGSNTEVGAEVSASNSPEDTAAPAVNLAPEHATRREEEGEAEEWSGDLATNSVFLTLTTTDTHNHFLRVDELADLIDEDEKEIMRILKVGGKWRRSDGYNTFLRSFGIIPRRYRSTTCWCLLGVGSIHMSLGTRWDIEFVLSSHPNVVYFGPDCNLQTDGPLQLPPGMTMVQFAQDCQELSNDIASNISCRKCKKPVPVGEWWFVRLESLATPILTAGVKAEVGIAFRCKCKAIHLGEPLPVRSRRGTVWSSEDFIVEVWGSTCPIRETGPAQPGRTHFARSPIVDRAGGEDATPSVRRGNATAQAGSPIGMTTPSVRGVQTVGGGGSGPSSGACTGGILDRVLHESRSSSSYVRPTPEEARASNHRGIYASVEGLLNMCTAVHKKSCGCPGPLTNAVLGSRRSDHDVFSAECLECGAVFGRIPTSKPDPLSIALGVVLAGGSFDQFERSLELSNLQSPSQRTLYRRLEEVVVAVDKVFEETFSEHRNAIKNEPGRGRMKVHKEKHFFTHYARQLEQRAESSTLGVQAGAISNATHADIAACLMVAARATGQGPGYVEDGEYVSVCPIQVSLDGAYRNRNHSSHGVNVVASVKLMERDHRGLMDVVLDQVTFGRHIGQDAPLQPVCALSRDGGCCHVHGKSKDWAARTRPGSEASEVEKDTAQRLRNGNCYSSTCLRSPLSAPATEPLGVIVLALRLMYHGFWVTAFAHDQDSEIGHLMRELFDDPLECLDRSHVQKNLKKAIIKYASGYASRVCRLFAWAVPKAKEMASECTDGSVSRAEAFTELFSHVIFHLQGNHAYCTPGCADSEETFVEEEPRGKVAEQSDIYDIDALREEDGVSANCQGDGAQNREVPRTAGANVGDTPAGEAVAGGAKKKRNMRGCVGSKFTAASLRQTLDDTARLGTVKHNLWGRVSSEISVLATQGGAGEDSPPAGMASLKTLQEAVMAAATAANHVVHSAEASRMALDKACVSIYGKFSTKEKKSREVHLEKVSGPWEPPPPDGEGWSSSTDGPARLAVVPSVQDAKKAYTGACLGVMQEEKAFRAGTGMVLTVGVAGSSQIEKSSVRHQAWAESRPWSFFSHCCNGLGGHVRASQPCPACDSHIAIITTCIRANAFMQDLGTQYLESVNGTIASNATKRSDFSISHWARGQLAIMNRVLPCGPLGVANRVRQVLGLPQLTEQAAQKAQAHDRRNMRVVIGQEYMTQDQKQQQTLKRYETKDAISARTSEYKQTHEQSIAADPIKPIGSGMYGVAAVRNKLYASTSETACAGSQEGVGDGNGSTTGTGGKGKKRRRTETTALPEYTAAGSNTDKNDELASEIRMGGTSSGGVCTACVEAHVGREFLLRQKHTRKGKKICPRIRQQWQAHLERTRRQTAGNI